MSPSERRSAILAHLCTVRHDTIVNLAHQFGVSYRTISNDITELTCSYPIETVRGRYGGGVKVLEGFRMDRRTLTTTQACLLKRLASTLTGEDLNTMNSIISQFGLYSR